MLRLHWILALCFWYFLLLHRWALADEEAGWGPTTANKNPPEKKPSNNWWTPSLPKFPSLPSLSFRIPFYGSSDDKDEAAASITASKGLSEVADHLQDNTGSGEGIDSEASQSPTALIQGLLTSVTEIRTEALPTGTSDTPHSSTVQSDNDAFVSPTISFIRNTLFANSLTSSNALEQNTADAHPPRETTAVTKPSMGVTTQHLTDEQSVYRDAEDVSVRVYSTIPPETTVPTALTWASGQTTTLNPGQVAPTSSHVLKPVTQPTFIRGQRNSTGNVEYKSPVGTMSEIPPTQSHVGQSFSGTSTLNPENQSEVWSSTLRIDHEQIQEFIASTTQSQRSNSTTAGELPGKEVKQEDEGVLSSAADEDADTRLTAVSTPPTTTTQSTDILPESPSILLYTEDWMSNLSNSEGTLLPDCNKERSGICNFSYTWDAKPSSGVKPTQISTATNQSNSPFLNPAPPMLVPLYTDWNSAMADWGLAWEAHIYGVGCAFAMLTLASALNLLCLPLRCPSGCGYFALVSLFLLAAGCTRSFSLLYDAYGHQDRIPSTEASLMLHEAPFPCITAAFGLVFLLLSMRSRMQLSYSAFQRPCFLACLVVLHFTAAFGPVTFLKFYQQKPSLCLLLSVISRGAFVALATFLSAAYFVFYIYVRADSKHIYHLNNTSPTPAERYNRCPFAESRDWNRAAVTVCLSALFSLACAGLQLYAVLNAMGVAGGEVVFHPWPWWAFQFSCRLCELGVCLTLALVVAQPVFCSDQLPSAGSCWTELLASKSPILPGTYHWTLSQQEKLAIVDTVGLEETESLPLYTLMDERLGNSLNGLDLLYHSNRALVYRDLDLDLGTRGLEKPEDGRGREPSGGSSFTSDSTADLRPPSPINLRRSIDEALFSEALFPMSLFSPTRPFFCSDMPVNNHWTLPSKGLCDPLSADPGFYRTSSCQEMASQPHSAQPKGVEGAQASSSMCSSSSCSSPERWRGSSSSCSLYRTSLGSSSLVLCPSPERHSGQLQGSTGHHAVSSNLQRHYQTLGAASQESLDLSAEADRSVQEEFISVCRQMDSSSICSETIDL